MMLNSYQFISVSNNQLEQCTQFFVLVRNVKVEAFTLGCLGTYLVTGKCFLHCIALPSSCLVP